MCENVQNVMKVILKREKTYFFYNFLGEKILCTKFRTFSETAHLLNVH